MANQEDIQITVADLIEIIAGNYTVDGKSIKDFRRTKNGYMQHFLSREVPAFDIDSRYDEWVKTASRHPWRYIIKKFPSEIEDIKQIVVLLLPAEKLRDASGSQYEPQYRHGYELPLLLINEALTDLVSIRLSNALPAIVQLQNLSCLKDRSYEFAFLFLVYTHLFYMECSYADKGISPILTHRSLEGCNLSSEKLRILQEMTVEQKIQLELELNFPIFKVNDILRTWDTYGQRLAAEQLHSVDAMKEILIYGTIPPSFIPFDRIRTDLATLGEPFEEPLVRVPLVEARLAEEIRSLTLDTETPIDKLLIDLINNGSTGCAVAHKRTKVFRECGSVRIACYDGRLTLLYPNTLGFEYISVLLSNPARQLPVLGLEALVQDYPGLHAAAESLKQLSESELAEFGLAINDLDNPVAVIDRKTQQSVKSKLQEIDEKLEGGRFDSPDDSVLLEESKRSLERYLVQATGLWNNARSFPTEVEKARQRVKKAIDRALSMIEQNHKPLWIYLKNHIQTGEHCAYSPDEPTTWEC